MKTLTTQLSSRVVQGMEQTDLQPNSLLKAQSKVSSAYLHGSSGMTSSASSLFGNLQNYVPPISVKSQNSVVYTSEQERMQTKVEEMLDVANAAIKIPLLSMLADEEEFSLSFGTTVVHAQRASISLIWTQVHYSGLYLKVPTTIFSHTGYNKDDVLQIIKVNADNPLGFNQVPDAPVNTYVADALFMDSLSGAEISVSSLPNDDQVMMYIFTNQANVYDIDSSSLINSTLYDPFSNTDGTTWHLEADRTVEAAISRVHQDAAAIHIQIKVEFLGCVGKLNAKLLKDDIPLTDADGEGVRPREITQDMISGQLDHRDFSFFDKAG